MKASLPYEQAVSLIMSFLSLVITLSLTRKFHYQDSSDLWFLGQLALCWFVSLRSFESGIDRWLLVVPLVLVLKMVATWPYSANHHFFYLWVAIPVLLRPDLLPSRCYSLYVSRSMGVMMLAAVVQKLIGGHYLNGSFFAYLATAGGETERLLNFLCGQTLTQSRMEPCLSLVWLSRLALIAQALIGMLLVLDVRSRLVYSIEILFLLLVGTIADEWVFQAINLLCILFVMRSRVPVWLPCGIVPFTLIGIHKLDTIMYGFLG